ncbi:MAG: nitroreductase family protein [Candidatus Tectomicrobia bacterium]|nr:nitroreductase family protein [Candidatus Tectomicrobia bacterium]
MHPADKRASTTYPIVDLLANRWSPRAFADRAIPADVLGSLFEAARWAPSSRNLQPWHFVTAERHRDPDGFARILKTLVGANRSWGKPASVLLIAVTEPKPENVKGGNTYAYYDVGQAMAHLSIQAMSCGLYIHQMGGFRRDMAQELLEIPDRYEPVVSAAIGYLADPSILSETMRERELAPRDRHPLSKQVFSAKWGQTHPDYA